MIFYYNPDVCSTKVLQRHHLIQLSIKLATMVTMPCYVIIVSILRNIIMWKKFKITVTTQHIFYKKGEELKLYV